MNPQRIEEIRKKLREGSRAWVNKGDVTVEGAPAPEAAPAPAPSSGAPAPAPGGFRVKPHNWGAEAAPFYESATGEARALAEQGLLVREYPGFEMDVDDDGMPYAHGWIGPNENLRSAYHLLLVIPPAYGRGAMPAAYVLEPRLRLDAPHIFQDGSLCLDHSGAFTRKSTLVTLLAWVSVWLVLYEGLLETGTGW
jgi:hypothetical protein